MKTDSGRSVSVWMATAEVPAQLPLTINARADVCIIGAGIAGMTTAYVLTREGKSVIVLDDGPHRGRRDVSHDGHAINGPASSGLSKV